MQCMHEMSAAAAPVDEWPLWWWACIFISRLLLTACIQGWLCSTLMSPMDSSCMQISDEKCKPHLDSICQPFKGNGACLISLQRQAAGAGQKVLTATFGQPGAHLLPGNNRTLTLPPKAAKASNVLASLVSTTEAALALSTTFRNSLKSSTPVTCLST